MSIVVKLNNHRLDGKGLVAIMDTTEDCGYAMFELLDSAKIVDATGCIKVKDRELVNSYCDIDMDKEVVALSYNDIQRQFMNSDKIRVEINIHTENK